MPGRSKMLLLAASVLALTGATEPAAPEASPPRLAAPVSPADSLFGQGDFAGAAAEYEMALAADPDAPGALAGLARIRLYQGREAEARTLANRALAAAPGDLVAADVLAMADIRASRFGPDRYLIDPRTAPAIAQFVITDPLPVIRVTIGGKERNFIIDTGAPDLMLGRKLADELGLETIEAGEGVFAGGGVRRSNAPWCPKSRSAGCVSATFRAR